MSGNAAASNERAERDDDELVTWWGLVIEGYHVTQHALMTEIERQFGLTPALFDVLIRLTRSPDGRMRMTKLANEAALTSGGFTKVADRLVRAELIRREPCDTDRRVSYAVLTERGRELTERARTVCADILRERVLGPLGTERAGELASTMRVLRCANSETDSSETTNSETTDE